MRHKLFGTSLKFARAVSLTCNRTLIASITGSLPSPTHRSLFYPGYYPPTCVKSGGAQVLVNVGFDVCRHLTPGLPACQVAEARLSTARAEPRGSAGHVWSAGFDWAVVVVTGRRCRSGRRVPGAARSPFLFRPLPSPNSPHGQEPGATRSPHGLRPGKDGLGYASPEPVPPAGGPGRGRARTWREMEADVLSCVPSR